MKRLILLSVLLQLGLSKLYSQNFSWSVKGGSYAYDYGYGIVTDNAGNIYVSGKYEENATFGSSDGNSKTIPCAGNHDIYVAKYNAAGVLQWINHAGGPQGDYSHAICLDSQGNVVIAGEIEWAKDNYADFGNGVVLSAKGDNDIIVAKYAAADGSLIWAKRAGGGADDKSLGISADGAGNIYATGFFEGTADFGANIITSAGGRDVFVAKLNSNGDFVWAKGAGSSARDEAKAISVTAGGEVYVTGFFKNTANFSGTQVKAASANFDDAFLAKYNADGGIVWVKRWGAEWDDDAWGVSADGNGKIYVTGEFNAYVQLENGSDMATKGMADAFIVCFNNTGNAEWAKRVGGKLVDRGRAIYSDGTNVYVTGQYGGDNADFGSKTFSSADSSDIFVSSFSAKGDFRWAIVAGGGAEARDTQGFESGLAIAANAGKVYVAGCFLGDVKFGNNTYYAYDHTDMFLAEINEPEGGLGIHDVDFTANSFNVYPNPNNGAFTYAFEIKETDNYQIDICNITGQRISSEELKGFAGTFSKHVDLMQLGKGTYTLSIRNSKGSVVAKKLLVY